MKIIVAEVFSAEKSRQIYAEFRRGFEMENIENPRFSRKIESSQSTAKPWPEEIFSRIRLNFPCVVFVMCLVDLDSFGV